MNTDLVPGKQLARWTFLSDPHRRRVARIAEYFGAAA
jgi:hypothetical protein